MTGNELAKRIAGAGKEFAFKFLDRTFDDMGEYVSREEAERIATEALGTIIRAAVLVTYEQLAADHIFTKPSEN
jgi:hypothetical protein